MLHRAVRAVRAAGLDRDMQAHQLALHAAEAHLHHAADTTRHVRAEQG